MGSIGSLAVAFPINLLEAQWGVEKVGSRSAIKVASPGLGRTVLEILPSSSMTFFGLDVMVLG